MGGLIPGNHYSDACHVLPFFLEWPSSRSFSELQPREMIHPTAVVHPKAKLDSTVRVGPHAVIDEHVELGPGCVVGPHGYLTGVVVAGARNRFHSGCVIGDAPVDLKYSGEATRVRLGNDNVFREHVTVNCSNTLAEDTVIGSGNFLTPHCHVGHNTRIGDHVILGGGAMLAG